MKARGLKPAGLFLFSPAFAHQHRDPVVRKLPLARMARAKTVEQCRRHGRVVYRGELRMVVALEDQHIEVALRENPLVILVKELVCCGDAVTNSAITDFARRHGPGPKAATRSPPSPAGGDNTAAGSRSSSCTDALRA